MELDASRTIPAPPEDVWGALNDPDVLRECIPNCESLMRESDTLWHSVMVARIGPVSAKVTGTVELADVNPPSSYTLRFEGNGAAVGFVHGEAHVRLEPADGGTLMAYSATAQVGGKLAQVGSRLVDGAAASLTEEFFTRFVARFPPPAGTDAT